jgi:hypothetical protein
MSNCVSCGHELGVGRFCTNCGRPVGTPDPEPDWRTDTAERRAAPSGQTSPPPTSPPPATAPFTTAPLTPAAGSVPPKPRFPLYADEVDDDNDPVPMPPRSYDQAPMPTQHRRRRPWTAWIAVAAGLVLVAALGVWLLTGDDDPDSTAADRGGRDRPTRSASSKPSDSPSSEAPPAPGDITTDSTVEVPATAPPNQDVEGNRVDFAAGNMLDGVRETCWRMAGDASGEEITITLPGEAKVRSVGLVNGYAKTARDAAGRELDWYHGNRRVLSVQWVFDDGTTLTQDLEDSTALQTIDVDGVTTSTITLRLVSVSAPGKGRATRDYTAISDLSIVSG